MVSRTAGAALGKLAARLSNPRWLAAQAAETALNITVLTPAGQYVKAYLAKHLYHSEHDQKIGEVYHCPNGQEYFLIDGKKYRHDTATDTWYNA